MATIIFQFSTVNASQDLEDNMQYMLSQLTIPAASFARPFMIRATMRPNIQYISFDANVNGLAVVTHHKVQALRRK